MPSLRLLLTAALVLAATCLRADDAEQPRISPLQEKLRTLIIPRIQVTDMPVADALGLIAAESRKLDPSGVGVNIVYIPPQPPPAREEGQSAEPPSPPVITVELTEWPVQEAISYLCTAASISLDYSIQEHAVVVHAQDYPLQPMALRSFNIGGIHRFVDVPLIAKGETPTKEERREQRLAEMQLIRDVYEGYGVRFPGDAWVAYDHALDRIVAYTDAENLKRLADIVHIPARQPRQYRLDYRLYAIPVPADQAQAPQPTPEDLAAGRYADALVGRSQVMSRAKMPVRFSLASPRTLADQSAVLTHDVEFLLSEHPEQEGWEQRLDITWKTRLTPVTDGQLDAPRSRTFRLVSTVGVMDMGDPQIVARSEQTAPDGSRWLYLLTVESVTTRADGIRIRPHEKGELPPPPSVTVELPDPTPLQQALADTRVASLQATPRPVPALIDELRAVAKTADITLTVKEPPPPKSPGDTDGGFDGGFDGEGGFDSFDEDLIATPDPDAPPSKALQEALVHLDLRDLPLGSALRYLGYLMPPGSSITARMGEARITFGPAPVAKEETVWGVPDSIDRFVLNAVYQSDFCTEEHEEEEEGPYTADGEGWGNVFSECPPGYGHIIATPGASQALERWKEAHAILAEPIDISADLRAVFVPAGVAAPGTLPALMALPAASRREIARLTGRVSPDLPLSLQVEQPVAPAPADDDGAEIAAAAATILRLGQDLNLQAQRHGDGYLIGKVAWQGSLSVPAADPETAATTIAQAQIETAFLCDPRRDLLLSTQPWHGGQLYLLLRLTPIKRWNGEPQPHFDHILEAQAIRDLAKPPY